MQRVKAADNLLTVLAACGLIAPLLFVALVLVAAGQYDGYNHAEQAISELGGAGAETPIVQNINFFIVGVLIMAFAVGLYGGIKHTGAFWLGTVLIGFFGLSSGIGNALLNCDPGCEFESVEGSLHNITGLAGFLAAVAGMLLIAGSLKLDERWRSLHTYTLLTAVAAFVSLAVWIVSKGNDLESVDGLLQRIFVGIWLLWVGVMALRLLSISRSGEVGGGGEMSGRAVAPVEEARAG